MLAPHDRSLLLDGLKPDPGYLLDAAVGTSFSLDIDALLLAPLSFALFDVDAGQAEPDPIAVLAAVRSYAGRMAIYTDAAHIKPPPKARPLFQMLERAILPVVQPSGAFHPKVWVLRFRSMNGDPPLHRALVLSRNLTFDRSWDTVLRLDQATSIAGETSNAEGLIDFLHDLQSRRPSELTTTLADSLVGVAFDPPHPFDTVRFWPMTADGVDPLGDAHDGARDLLAVAPFADGSRLSRLAPSAKRRAFVSRQDTLDRLGCTALQNWSETYVLHSEAARTDDYASPSGEDADEALAGLSGLHAKLYVVDDGRQRRVFTGSANATTAALQRNVELLVELRSTHASTLVEALLGDAQNETNLRRLLVPGGASQDEPLPESAEEAEARRLEDVARSLADGALRATCLKRDGGWTVAIELETAGAKLAGTDRLQARLVTTGSAWTPVDVAPGSAKATLEAGRASRLTSLVAFTLDGHSGLDVLPHRFVLVAELVNAPPDRDSELLLDLIPDAQAMMRLLFMLLADGQPGSNGASEVRRLIVTDESQVSGGWELSLPLLEGLVRTFAREPDRLRTIGAVISRLRANPEAADRFRPGFLDLWSTVMDALPDAHPSARRARPGSRAVAR